MSNAVLQISQMYEFTAAARMKGWRMVDLAERWGVSPRQMSNIAKSPKPRDWDALRGLPARG